MKKNDKVYWISSDLKVKQWYIHEPLNTYCTYIKQYKTSKYQITYRLYNNDKLFMNRKEVIDKAHRGLYKVKKRAIEKHHEEMKRIDRICNDNDRVS